MYSRVWIKQETEGNSRGRTEPCMARAAGRGAAGWDTPSAGRRGSAGDRASRTWATWSARRLWPRRGRGTVSGDKSLLDGSLFDTSQRDLFEARAWKRTRAAGARGARRARVGALSGNAARARSLGPRASAAPTSIRMRVCARASAQPARGGRRQDSLARPPRLAADRAAHPSDVRVLWDDARACARYHLG